ncbi:MAG: ADP-ribosylglycohydrolase family protein [Defluviimonas denitrificans]
MDRALGALIGVALGDALGMPSQTLPRARIAAAYGRITDLIDPVADHPVSHGLRAGMVTDDTEQTLLLADLMIRSPAGVDDRAWAEALLGWERDVRARGLRDLLGPSSKRALDALLPGCRRARRGARGRPTAPPCGSRRWHRDPARRSGGAGRPRCRSLPGDP